MASRLPAIGAICAILTTVSFVAGVVLLGTNGVENLIPETGEGGLAWIGDVDDAGDVFFGGAWLIILTTMLGAVALVGFYEVLKDAGPSMILAPVLGIVGLTLVTISHLIPISLAYDLVPGYVAADEATRTSLAVTFDTLANLSLVLNYVGNALGWGVSLPLFAVAILRTQAIPRWIGWLGLAVAVLAGWLGLLAPASSVIEGVTTLGFLAFFAFMLAMGIAILLRLRRSSSS